ncbi:hypothetical protein M1D88_20230 [Arthrobacter sp. R1-13]
MQERADFEATKPEQGSGHTPPRPQYGQRLPQDPATAEHSSGFQNEQTAGLQNYGEYQQGVIPGRTAPPAPQAPREDVVRGTLFSLVAIPAGVILWLILWNVGLMASIVGFVAAAGAARMYVLGSGSFSRNGVWVVAAVTLITVLVSFVGGMWLDMAQFMGGASPFAMLLDPQAWELLGYNLTTNADLVETYKLDFLVAVLLGALGCFFTLRRMFAETRK